MAAMLQGPGGVDADAKEAVGLVDPAQTLRLSFRVRFRLYMSDTRARRPVRAG